MESRVVWNGSAMPAISPDRLWRRKRFNVAASAAADDAPSMKNRWRYKPVHGLQIDVIGIHMIGRGPTQLPDCGIRGRANRARVGTDKHVFPVRLVPHRNHITTLILGQDTGAQLRLGLMRETVADTNGVFGKLEHEQFSGVEPEITFRVAVAQIPNHRTG
jgi:hypothetical protein